MLDFKKEVLAGKLNLIIRGYINSPTSVNFKKKKNEENYFWKRITSSFSFMRFR